MPDLSVSGILFDSDGTLIDSTPSVLRVMSLWCTSQSIDPRQFAMEAQHGTRTIDLLRKFQRVPKKGSEMSEEELEVEVERLEGMVMDVAGEMEGGIRALLGVEGFLSGLKEVGFENWGVVTSATRCHAVPALELAGIKDVPFIVSGEQVSRGKPDPEPYLAGLKRLKSLSSSNDSIDPSTVLVIEDAPAGFVSGRAAGCKVFAVCTGPTSEEEVKKAARANRVPVVRDLQDVEIVGIEDGKLKLRIKEFVFEEDRN